MQYHPEIHDYLFPFMMWENTQFWENTQPDWSSVWKVWDQIRAGFWKIPPWFPLKIVSLGLIWVSANLLKSLYFLWRVSSFCLPMVLSVFRNKLSQWWEFWWLWSRLWTVISCVPGCSDLPIEQPTMVQSGKSQVQGFVDLITVILGILWSWVTHLSSGLQSLRCAPGLSFPSVAKHFWEAEGILACCLATIL